MTDRDFSATFAKYVDRFRYSLEDVAHLLGPRIQGVEVTQAIQHYRSTMHLTDPADQGADNSLRLVANKAAWVRVYVRPGLLTFGPASVSGTLEVQRRRFGFQWNPVTTLNPEAPGSVAVPTATTYHTERSSVADTLNFIIPSSTFHGYLRLKVEIEPVGGGNPLDTHVLDIDACLRQTLRIRAILVSYNGASTADPGPPAPTNINIAAPTLADVQATAARAHRMMPVEATGSYVSAGTVVCDRPLDDPRSCNGCCSPNWDRLLNRLTNQRTADGNRADVVYYGLLPAGIPLGVPGCGIGGLGSAVTGDQATFVHEIGHGYGFQHTPCGNTGTPDPNYPNYQPHPSASIGEYGLDISNGNVLPPQGTFDYMSYCGPQWMSKYQHNRLINHARLDPERVCDEPWWKDYFEEVYEWWRWPWPEPPPPDPWRWIDMRLEPIISITGIVRSAHDVEVASVARVAATTTLTGEETRLTAVLLDEDGEQLAAGRVVRLRTHGGCGCDEEHGPGGEGEPFNFQAFIPDVGRGAALVIRDSAGEDLWARRAPKHPPEVGEVSAAVGKDDTLELRWSQETAAAEPEAWLQWSADGEHWRGLATGIMDTSVALPLEGLPAGEVQLRVLVHDGFSTAMSAPAVIEVPDRGPVAAILHPRGGQTVVAGRPMQLWAVASDQAGDPLDDEAARWDLDGERVGSGREVWLTAPPPGEHEVVLTVVGPGEDARVAARFTTVGADGDDGGKQRQENER